MNEQACHTYVLAIAVVQVRAGLLVLQADLGRALPELGVGIDALNHPFIAWSGDGT